MADDELLQLAFAARERQVAALRAELAELSSALAYARSEAAGHEREANAQRARADATEREAIAQRDRADALEARRGGLFPPEMKLSIVMVSHGALEWTERALAAVTEHTSVEHEVIVVDNASTDGTVERLRQLPVRLIVNDINRGFGPASNQGAEVATAPMLVFLNTDALVDPGWHAPLERALAIPGAAAAVPLVLELDGRIQCAGALLGRDGTVIEHGNGADPRERAYRFPRVVDFGPGACLAVRADAFTGFDDAYAPAYYEDADLCLALPGRTLYVPGSTVRHKKKASGGANLAQQLSDRHRAFFAERWRERLIGRPSTLSRPTPEILLAARDAPADGRILVRDPSVLDTLLEARPFARISLVGDDEAWLSRGVELITPETAAQRRHHYDVELDAPPGDLPRALAAGGLL